MDIVIKSYIIVQVLLGIGLLIISIKDKKDLKEKIKKDLENNIR